jgi:integrase
MTITGIAREERLQVDKENPKLTQATVTKLVKTEIPAEGSKIIWDARGEGFGLRLTAGGIASFILNYRNAEGRERRCTIGRWPEWRADEAYFKALELRKAIKSGEDPLVTQKAEELATAQAERTVSDLAKDYMQNHAEIHKRPSSVRNDRSMLQGVILPRIGQVPLATIKKQDIESLHNSLRATPYRANRVRALLSTMFNRAIDPLGWMTANPVKGIPKYFGGNEPKRESWLTKEQVEAVRKALDNYPVRDSANAIKLLALTGSRPGEVLGAQWTAFDLKQGVWTKPNCATKQKKTEHVPLSPPALALLREMSAAKNGSPYLFPGHARPGKERTSRTSLKLAWTAIAKAAGLAEEYKVRGKGRYSVKEFSRWRPMFRLYDLRHTFASHLVSNGTSLYLVGKLLGHSRSQTTERYAHVDDAATRKATESFASNIGW